MKSSYPRLPFLILPITRREMPGWGRLYRLFRIGDLARYHRWQDAPAVIIRGKWHGYRMTLNLSNWSERHTFFLGRYYDLETQLLVRQLLQSGDRFIDVGANIGMISLVASQRVGPQGRVDAIEPNPRCVQRIESTLQANGIDNVHLLKVGFSDEPGTATLRVVTDHDGMGTLADVPDRDQALISREFEVNVTTGDDELGAIEQAPIGLKIDVEGLEMRVLRGTQKLVARHHPAVITEYVSDHLSREGTTLASMSTWFAQLGYRGFAMTNVRAGWRRALRLRALDQTGDLHFTDICWLHPDSEAYRRLEVSIAGHPA